MIFFVVFNGEHIHNWVLVTSWTVVSEILSLLDKQGVEMCAIVPTLWILIFSGYHLLVRHD
jgi:hypothetical protein